MDMFHKIWLVSGEKDFRFSPEDAKAWTPPNNFVEFAKGVAKKLALKAIQEIYNLKPNM